MMAPDPPTPRDESFPKTLRLLRGAEFDAVYKLRQSVSDGWLVLHARPNDLGHARLGLSVSRRVGNAVVRNRWKRCLREAFRLCRHQLPALDLVVTPRGGGMPDLERALRSLSALVKRVERKLNKSTASPGARGSVHAGSAAAIGRQGAISSGHETQEPNSAAPAEAD